MAGAGRTLCREGSGVFGPAGVVFSAHHAISAIEEPRPCKAMPVIGPAATLPAEHI